MCEGYVDVLRVAWLTGPKGRAASSTPALCHVASKHMMGSVVDFRRFLFRILHKYSRTLALRLTSVPTVSSLQCGDWVKPPLDGKTF